MLALVIAGPALAQTPRGGSGGSGSAAFTNGGLSSATGAGDNGLDGANATRGGGGGGAGVTSGAGGSDSSGNVLGGSGTDSDGNGYDGENGDYVTSGGGGAGGVHGAVVTTGTTNSGTVAGTRGGDGGSTTGANRSGGGGGAGGYGAVVDGSGLTYTNSSTGIIRGGNGGAGGANTLSDGYGGNGGDGGIGVFLSGGSVLSNAGSIAGGSGGKGGNAPGSSFSSSGGDGGDGGVGVYASGPATVINSGSITGGSSGNAGTGSSPTTGGTAGDAGLAILGADLTVINSGTISGGLQAGGPTTANAITFTGGINVLEIHAGSIITGNVVGTGTDTFRLGGATDDTFDVSSIGPAAQYQGFSSFVKTGTGTWTLTGTTTATTPWSINQGVLAVSSDGSLGDVSGGLTLDGGTLRFLAGFVTSRVISLNGSGGSFHTNGNNATLAGDVVGTGGLTKIGLGTLSLSGTGTYTGETHVNAGVLQAGATGAFSSASAFTVASGAILDLNGFDQAIGSLAGGGAVTLGAATLTTGGDNGSTVFAGTISGSGGLTKSGSGTLRLTGTSTYSGATIINGGTLDVEGTLGGTSAVTVNAGGTLSGEGLIDPLTVTINAGGVLAPGNGTAASSMTIDGNLVMQSGAIYRVQLDPSAASFTTVHGTASLGGATVNAVFANGAYVSKSYTILTASGGISGTFASDIVSTNLPANFQTSLSYDANDAYLNLALNFGIPSGLNGNQQAVGSALTDSFNRIGGIPAIYAGLTPAGLTQASGETATGAQQATFDAMGRFAALLTDPTTRGIAGGGGASGFADQHNDRRINAFARLTRAPAASFEQRWNVWAAGVGGAQSTSGNATAGSNDATSRTYAVAAGADHWLSAQTVTGFALAGGGTSFGVNGQGSGRSDLFQAGIHLRHTEGRAFIAAALAYGWQDITTDRTVTIAGTDRLRANVRANAWAGRLEGGYRFVLPVSGGVGLAPYAAVQAALFDQPGYAEQVVSGASTFALGYAGKRLADNRSELGLRSDKSFAVPDGMLALRGRLAWAHDFNPDRSAAASFLALPGASFAVSGAAQARDSALTTTSVEMTWAGGWSAAASFEGEFSRSTRAYAGKGVVRFAW